MAIRQATKSLVSRHNPLTDTMVQLEVLNPRGSHVSDLPSFTSSLNRSGIQKLTPHTLQILQVNVGKLCNQACNHCHVDAGPDRMEQMSKEVFDACLNVVAHHDIPTVDITGGAPELNPHFRWFVEECRKMNR